MQYNAAMQQNSTGEKNILVLQGGGALGAYQAGAYEAMLNSGHEPSWIAGISIGAINAAIIAGNKPEYRVAKLKAFWDKTSSGLQGFSMIPGDQGRSLFNEMSSITAMMFGIPGFYSPRMIPPLLSMPGTAGATSFYDTTPLRETLLELVDFKLINEGPIRLSVGAVNVRSGNFRYFDTTTDKITVDHIMASGALPPGFPPILIEGEYYWDGGIVSNTPLHYVLDQNERGHALCIYQIDLFPAIGALPRTIIESAEREKEIRFSSRTRMNTAAAMAEHKLHKAAMNLLKKLPADLQNDPDVNILRDATKEAGVTIMHLIKRSTDLDTQSKDNEFSRLSMGENWAEGHQAVIKSLEAKAWKTRKIPADGMTTFDFGVVHKDESR
jgi:NTE family protein